MAYPLPLEWNLRIRIPTIEPQNVASLQFLELVLLLNIYTVEITATTSLKN